MKSLRLLFSFFFIMSTCILEAQVFSYSKNNQSQRQVNERLARQFYSNKEYDKAKDLYLNLYNDYKQDYYFIQYTDCLLGLGDYEQAEKELKSFVKQNTNNWKAQIDLAYVYIKENEKDKAGKLLNKLINSTPENKSSILQIANVLRSRGFNEYAIALYDKGTKSSVVNYSFYIEKATTYQSMLIFDKAIENYLFQLEIDHSSYDLIKNRFRIMMLYDVDNSINDEICMALLRKTQEDTDNEQFAELLVWFALQKKDYDMALTHEMALDRRFGDKESDILYLAEIARDNEQYDIAIKAYDYIVKKEDSGVFYIKSAVGLIEMEYKKALKENNDDIKFYDKLSKYIDAEYNKLGFNEQTIPLILTQANILSYRLDKYDNAIDLLNRSLNLPMSKYDKAKIKMELADIYLFKDEIWEATLLYSQIDKSMKEEPIGHEARFKNARLRYFIGEFEWALASLNILKAATSKLIANDAMTLSLLITDNLEYDTIGLQRIAKADYYIYQKRYDLANKMLDSVNAYNPNEMSMPYLLYRKARMAMDMKDYNLADSLYKRIYQGYANSYMADEALMDDALLLEQYLDRKDEAMECYVEIIDDYTASVYVAQARKNYRRLRD